MIEHFERRNQEWKILSLGELKTQMLENSRDFEDEWRLEIQRTKDLLLRKYDFLKIIPFLNDIDFYGTEINDAILLAKSSELTSKQKEQIVSSISRSIEFYLGVVYVYLTGKTADGMNMGQLVSALGNNIREDLGEDTFKDLDYLRTVRNQVAHPHKIDLSNEELLKISYKADLFVELFRRKYLKGSID